jgi:hypothetical protein
METAQCQKEYEAAKVTSEKPARHPQRAQQCPPKMNRTWEHNVLVPMVCSSVETTLTQCQ